MKIFYSWQSDLPNPSNRGFIGKALENVAKTLINDRTLDIELSIDRDTIGVSGSPEIVSTIFSKIEQADIFVCDISIINSTNRSRPSPNPNVLVELGYALKALGENRIILILNTAYGKVEKLPFDLRARRVLTYTMSALADERATERKKLESMLEQAIRAIRPRLSLSAEYLKTFENESERAKQLAYEQPALWEYLLTVELLHHKIQNIKNQSDEIVSGQQYIKTVKLSNKDYLNFIQEKNVDLQKIAKILVHKFPNSLTSAWGPKGKPGNALEIKKVADELISTCEAILEWEKEIYAVQPSIIFANLKEILQGCTTQMIRELEDRISELQNIVEQPNPEGPYKITLTIQLPEKWAEKVNQETIRIGQWFAGHPREWNEE